MVLMITLVQQKKKLVFNFSETKTNFCLNLYYSGDERYLLINETNICKFQTNCNIDWYNFPLGSKSKDEQSDISLTGTVYDFSVDHFSIKKEDILNIPEYLMIKNNIK